MHDFSVLPAFIPPLLASVLGLLFGSFTNVLIYRVPRGEEFIKTPSHCTACGHSLKWYELIPVLSYIGLLGRCKSCKTRISPAYPIIVCVSALLYALCAYKLGLSVEALVGFCLITALIALSVIDWRTMEIPDGFQLFILIAGVAYNVYAALAGRGILVQNIIGFFAVSMPLYLIGILTGGMGGGDVKLMAVCGLILGWQLSLAALGLAAVIGVLVMLPLHIIGKKKREEPIPFGPFLASGVLVSFLFGADLLQMWLG